MKQYDFYEVRNDVDDPQPTQCWTLEQVGGHIKRRRPEGAMVFGIDYEGGETYLGWCAY